MTLETAESHNARLTGKVDLNEKESKFKAFKERIENPQSMKISEGEWQFLLDSIEKVGRVDALKSASNEELITELQKRGFTVK